MITVLFLFLAGFCLYLGARQFGQQVTMIYWGLVIGAALIYGFFTDDMYIFGAGLISILFAWDDWKNFDKN